VTLRGYLRRFLFKEEQLNQIIGQLSGGERSRVLLAKILKRGGNVLILDEPTNDLDLATLRILEEALVQFKGTVVVVSHDRYFLNRVCTHVLAIEGDGSTVFNVGNYDQHLASDGKPTPKGHSRAHKEPPKTANHADTVACSPRTSGPRSPRAETFLQGGTGVGGHRGSREFRGRCSCSGRSDAQFPGPLQKKSG
jgi:ABC-type multidrug transport system ATPase subunit